MKPFELTYLCAEPFMIPLYGMVRKQIRTALAGRAGRASLLDVGGRKSHYTVGLRADVLVTDLPRQTAVQEQLHLGLTDGMIAQLQRRRSNITGVQYDDMTRTTLDASSFDVVVAVEVLEHVPADADFVAGVRRVLRPGGVFIMTTPNGDFIESGRNPDHVRHYRRAQLRALLATQFGSVDVSYAILSGALHRAGLQSWSARRPLRTVASMLSNFLCARQSAAEHVREQMVGTEHLVAVAHADPS